MSSEYKSQRMTQLLFVKHTGEDSLNKVTPVQNSAKTIPVMIEKLHNSLKERKGEGERERERGREGGREGGRECYLMSILTRTLIPS